MPNCYCAVIKETSQIKKNKIKGSPYHDVKDKCNYCVKYNFHSLFLILSKNFKASSSSHLVTVLALGLSLLVILTCKTIPNRDFLKK